MAVKPVYLSPFEKIVGVGWATGKFAALTFDSDWRHDDGLENPNNFSVHVGQLGVNFPIYSNVNVKRDDGVQMILAKPPIRTMEKSTTGGSGMKTYKWYDWHMVGPGSMISNGGWYIRVQTVGGVTSANFVGSPPTYPNLAPPYDQTFASEENAIMWQVSTAAAAGAVLTYNLTHEDGPYVVDGEGHTVIHQADRAVILFDLSAIAPKLGTDKTLKIDFETGEGPGGGWDDLGNWYVWTAQLSTYKPAKWKDFAGDLPTWPGPASGASDETDVVKGSREPTPDKHLTFIIDMTTLAVTL